MHERRFNREVERLRDPDRFDRLEANKAVNFSLNDLVNVIDVLDIGTGSGVFAEQFANNGLKVIGLDVNPEMLAAAQKYVPSAIFKEGIAEQLPFLDGSFDLVFMGLLLHETDDMPAAISEAYRVTRQRLAVLEWPDEEQSFGPPLQDRISLAKLQLVAQQSGFSKFQEKPLKNLMLYLIDK
jgi:ubiquinone/menaquinone biosynthesis C-methylase UbiE